MTFQFSLQSVLDLRQYELNLRQQAVATAQSEVDQVMADRDQLASDRMSLLGELRDLNNGQSFPLNRVRQRQQFAEQLAESLSAAEARLKAAQTRLQQSLDQLVTANQSVRLLELLCDRQYADYRILSARQVAKEMDDITTSRLHRSLFRSPS